MAIVASRKRRRRRKHKHHVRPHVKAHKPAQAQAEASAEGDAEACPAAVHHDTDTHALVHPEQRAVDAPDVHPQQHPHDSRRQQHRRDVLGQLVACGHST